MIKTYDQGYIDGASEALKAASKFLKEISDEELSSAECHRGVDMDLFYYHSYMGNAYLTASDLVLEIKLES